MKNLFFRLYLLLILTFIGLGWSLDQVYEQVAESKQIPTDLELHKGTLFLLNRELARLPEQNQQAYLSALAPSFGYPVSLLLEAELHAHLRQYQQQLTPAQKAYLRQGGQVAIIDDASGLNWFLQAQSNSDNIIVFGPIRLLADNNNAVFMALFLVILAFVVFVWVWPLSRGLLVVTKAAQGFGEGDFSVRISSQVARPLLPVVTRFNDMAGRIQRLIRSHKELSHAVSHELRTPIARIRFAMEMTRELPSEAQREHYFDAMNDNIEELDGLVDELLTYARFDREEPQLTFAQQRLQPLLEEVIAKFEMIESHIQFTIINQLPQQQQVAYDRDGIARVLDNLLRNGVRYAQRQIRIVACIEQEQIQLTVEDDGPGVPEANWDNLFDPFVRLDKSRDRNSGGIGLGLAIVRRYLEWHHGSVAIANSELGGAKFILTWPLNHN